MRNALEVAQYFVENGRKYKDLSNLKIQKLLYYAQGFHLALYGLPLFLEDLEAWDHGPVVPAVYHELKSFGAKAITFYEYSSYQIFDNSSSAFLNKILEMFGKHSAATLRDMTHRESPWTENYKKPSQSISQSSIRQFFSNRLDEFDFSLVTKQENIDAEAFTNADEELLELARQASYAISRRKQDSSNSEYWLRDFSNEMSSFDD